MCDAAAKGCELILDILHASPFLCYYSAVCGEGFGEHLTRRRRGAEEHKRLWMFFAALGAMLLVSRLCHVGILWERDAYPLAAAGQMAAGKMLYRDIWFDKPP